MAKSITVQRKVLKLNSEDIKNFTKLKLLSDKNNINNLKTIENSTWEYEIDINPNKMVDYIISLGSSNTLRILDRILNRNENIQELYFKYKDCIKKIKSNKIIDDEDLKNKSIKWFYDEIYKMQFQENYIVITFNTKKDYKLLNKNGLIVNNKHFKRLYGTSASVKNNTVMYVCCDKNKKTNKTIHEELLERLENGYNKNVPLKPSKYESYLSLNSSASTPTSYIFKPEEILVVPDHVTKFNTNATLVHECVNGETNIEEINDNSYEFEYEQSDGGGVIDISIAEIWANDLHLDYIPSGFVGRNAFLKGLYAPMDTQDFTKEYENEIGDVYDIWNLNKDECDRVPVDISKIKMIIPTSMLKLWKNYSSIDDYLNNCNKFGHNFSITKVAKKELEHERTLNYQFVQSLDMNKEDAYNFIKPTIDEFHDILKDDYRKTILYLKGKHITEASVGKLDPDFIKALMIDKRVLNDSYVRQNIRKMISNAINEAKIAKIKCDGNYQFICPDMVAFLSHAFNFKNPIRALNSGEFYSNYWLSKNIYEVLLMRAPMCTYANYRKVNLVNNKMCKWFKYMKNVFVFNGYDTTAESLSGADKILSLISEV